MEYIQFRQVDLSGMITYKLDIFDVRTLEFHKLICSYLAKPEIEMQAIRPNGLKDWVKIYARHNDWRWLQSLIKISIIYDTKLSNKFRIADFEILPTFYTKAKKQYKCNYTREEFTLMIKERLMEYLGPENCGIKFIDD